MSHAGAEQPIGRASIGPPRAADQEEAFGGIPSTEGASRRRRARLRLGAAPHLALLAAAGLLLIAFGNEAARNGSGNPQQALFWAGLVLIYAPITFRLISSSGAREERIALVLTLGAALFMAKVLRSPTDFTRFDELGWWRATWNVIASGGSFSANPIVVSTSGFPGLSTVTAAISEVTGLNIFHSGLALIGAARVVLMLALFLFLERTSGSARAAGAAVAVYACNPSFLYFDAQFGYESLALMLAMTLLLATLRWSDRSVSRLREALPGTVGVLIPLSVMLVITHHMTTLAALAFCALWTVAILVLNRGRRFDYTGEWLAGPGVPTAVIGVAAVVWFGLVAGDVTVAELGGVFSNAFHSLLDLISGNSGSKQLFGGSGKSEPVTARVLVFASVIPALVVVVLGVMKMWGERDDDPLRVSLAGVAVLYPLTLGLRVTAASSEASQRASEFVFIGVAFLAGTLIARWETGREYLQRMGVALAITGIATLAFLGGFIIGELQATRQPGPYQAGAEDRSITRQGLAAARFGANHLPDHSRILTDRTNATLLGAYGDLNPVFGRFGDTSLPRILFGTTFDEADRTAIDGQSISYLVVDRRLSRETPLIGYYVESDEDGAFERTAPVSLEALKKFEAVPGVSKVYSNGPISIYDTSALLRQAP